MLLKASENFKSDNPDQKSLQFYKTFEDPPKALSNRDRSNDSE